MKILKKILLCFVALISGPGLARAEDVLIFVARPDDSQRTAPGAPLVVYQAPVDEYQNVNAKFDFDWKLGRAWVDIERVDTEFTWSRSTVKRKVEGLSYDSETRKVLYQLGDRSITCGEAPSFLGSTTIHSTGNCPLVVSYEERTVDDGFHLSRQTIAKVTLNPEIWPTQTAQSRDPGQSAKSMSN